MIRKVVLCAAVAFALSPALLVSASAQSGYEEPERRPDYEQPRRAQRPSYDEPRRAEPYGGCKFVMRPVDTGGGYKETRRVLVCPD